MAAAGYGKTSLLRQFVQSARRPVVWLSLDEADRDPRTLGEALSASLSIAFSQLGKAPRGPRRKRTGVEGRAENLAESIAALGPFAVCLDNVEAAASSDEAVHFLAGLLERLPGSLPLLLAGRHLPPALLPRPTARGGAAVLAESELRFTGEETERLLARLRPARAGDARRLASDTEGWIAGILLGLPSSHPSDSAILLERYFETRVWAGLAEGLQRFLMESAVLPEMDVETLDAVLDREDSAALLREARTRHLFLTGDEPDDGSGHYHRLFRRFLMDRLRSTSPDRLKELRARAGAHFEGKGRVEQAVTFYFAAGMRSKAAAVVETQAWAFYAAGKAETLEQWRARFSVVPSETPTLELVWSRVLAERGRLADAGRALDAASAGYEARQDPAGRVAMRVHRSAVQCRNGRHAEALATAEEALRLATERGLMIEAALARRQIGACRLAMGDLRSAEESLRTAADALEPAGPPFERAWALHDLARALRAEGRPAEASRAQREALAVWREARNPGPLAAALYEIARDQHMLGDLAEARATYVRALGYAREAGAVREELLLLAAMAELWADAGDARRATEVMRYAFERSEASFEPELLGRLHLARAHVEREAGEPLAAAEWLRRAECCLPRPSLYASGVAVLRGLLQIDMGDASVARDWLLRVRGELEETGFPCQRALASVGQARAEFDLGEKCEALASLRRALDTAAETGQFRALIVEARRAPALLELAERDGALRPRVLALRRRMGAGIEALGARRASPFAEPSQAFLTVHALGGARIRREGVELERGDWGSLIARELLLYIIDHGPAPKEALLVQFWGHLPHGRAAKNCRETLYRLRRVLGEAALVSDNGTCRLTEGHKIAYDARDFEAAAEVALGLCPGEPGRVAALLEAMDRYSGDYLPGLSSPWIVERRRALQARYLDVLREYAEELMALTRLDEVEECLERGLRLAPLRDDLHERMLRCLAGLGRRHEVVQHYRRYRELLRRELGLDPPEGIRLMCAHLIE